MTPTWLIPRRRCLKGLGVALALPLLETMGWADPPRVAAYKAPIRLGFVYMPLGVNTKQFWPSDPKTYPVTLPPSLEPLRAVIDQCLLLEGVDNVDHGKLGNAAHALELSTWLTATLPDENKRDTINIATSIDQIAAQHIGLYTPLPSLELATQGNSASGTGQEGLNNMYYTTGSFGSPTQPLPVETNPGNVLKRLFSSRQSTPRKRGGPAVDTAKFASSATGAPADEQTLDRSMLDLVMEEAKGLRARVSLDDQHRLDDYLGTVRSLETRVAAIERQQAEAAKAAKGGAGSAGASDFKRSEPIEVKIPPANMKWSEHVKVMGDLMILAFQADLTRVCTLMTSHPQGINYPELGFSDGHHDVSHHDADQAKLAKVAQIDRFNIEQFAYIVAKMKTLREGPGTLLDNSILLWGSGQEDGSNHSNRRLPTIIAGKGGGTIRTGRHVPKANGNHGDLLTAILARAGVPVERPIGIGAKLLPDLS
jgi:hypothetical protein